MGSWTKLSSGKRNKVFIMKKLILLTPGPTPLPEEVRHALGQPIVHHRTPVYQEVVKEVAQLLQYVFQTSREVLTFTSSGTGAMEASVVNLLSPGDKVLVVVCGKFGERFAGICKGYGLTPSLLQIPWGDSCDPGRLEETLKAQPGTEVVFGTLCETSTGALNDVEAMAKACHRHGALFVVDTISALAADLFYMDSWKIDGVVSGSQKGLMIPPGLSFLSLNEEALARVKTAKLPRFYFDVAKMQEAAKKWDSPFTPGISLVVALRESLRKIKGETLEVVWERTGSLARATRDAVRALGLELLAKHPSQAVTAVKVPPGLDGSEFLKRLREEGIWVAGGQGQLKGKIFRIAHMGAIQQAQLEQGIAAVEKVLAAMGYSFKKGSGVKAFQEALSLKIKVRA